MKFFQAFTLAILSFFSTIATATEPPARATIKGIVTDEAGKPVEGATVYVWTAAVKTGYSNFCPSCYPDCGKRAQTNANGEFEFSSLDAELRFKLMVAKSGFAPTTKPKVDPSALESVVIKLNPRPPLPLDPDQMFTGRVVDFEGKPVAHAMVSPQMVYWKTPDKDSSGSSSADGLEEFVITDEQGGFTLSCNRAIGKWDLEISARGFATKIFPANTRTDTPASFKLGPGAIVHGRLMHNGKPVPNAQMVLTHGQRAFGVTLGYERIGTDSDGYFTFANVGIAEAPSTPEYDDIIQAFGPIDAWWLAATMNSLKGAGATIPKLVQISKHGEEIDVGEMTVEPAFHIKGKVITTDGSPIPAGSRISISSETVWDPVLVELASDGSFTFEGLFPGDWSINPNVRGFVISPKNPNYSGTDIGGRVTSSVDDLLILVDSKLERSHVRHRSPDQPFKSYQPK